MKTLLSLSCVLLLLAASGCKQPDRPLPVMGVNAPTNLVSIHPYFPLITPQIAATNGIKPEITLDPSGLYCRVSVWSYSTNQPQCLRLPLTNMLALRLVDAKGDAVARTASGSNYGHPVMRSDVEVAWKRFDMSNRHQSPWLSFWPNAYPNTDFPMEIGAFNLKEVFQIERAGDYTLGVQLLLTQRGIDPAGKPRYVVLPLPEKVVPIHVSATGADQGSNTN